MNNFKHFPRGFIGKAVCLLTLFTTVGVLADRAQGDLNASLEDLKETLSIPKEVRNRDITDPQYKKTLNFIGAWFWGDQVGESAVEQAIGGSKMEVSDQLYTFVQEYASSLNTKDRDHDLMLMKLRNALHIHEIIMKLGDPALKTERALKSKVISKLNKDIFAAVDGGSEVVIPVRWVGRKPGSLLMSLSKKMDQYSREMYVLRIFDTLYKFSTNARSPDNGKEEYPHVVSVFKEIRFDSDFQKKTSLLVTGLTILQDTEQLASFEAGPKMNWFISKILSFISPTLSRDNFDEGGAFFHKKYLMAFGEIVAPSERVTWPLRRLSIGPVGNIQAFLATSHKEVYMQKKVELGYRMLKNFLHRFASDTDLHMEMRNDGVVHEIVKGCADQLLKQVFEMARYYNWIPKQVGSRDNLLDYNEYKAELHENHKNKAKKDEDAELIGIKLKKSQNQLPSLTFFGYMRSHQTKLSPKQDNLLIIDLAIKLRKRVLSWLDTKQQDTNRLTQISRSQGQREIPLKQVLQFNIESDFDMPVDLTRYLGQGTSSPDYNNCMAGADGIISSLDDFIVAFAPMESNSWKWTKFHFDVRDPHCKPYFRRNAESLLRTAKLYNLDQQSLSKWAPKSFRQYRQFVTLSTELLNLIVTLPSSQRTLEDYLILMRLQSVAWRVAQALDQEFAVKDPKRHLGLVQYTLAVPQCHKLLQGDMTYSNYFLADSGAYGNILNTASVTELRHLCQQSIHEEASGKAVLDYGKYSSAVPMLIDRNVFDFDINHGDREIYYKMAQNERIARTVAESLNRYDYGAADVTANAARAAALGEAGAQFIYYQFFDAMRFVFTANEGIKSPVKAVPFLKLTLIPMRVLEGPTGSIFPLIAIKGIFENDLSPVNVELMRGPSKSYTKTTVTEMLSAHILGLDIVLNHLVKGSSIFWSSESIFKDDPEPEGFFMNIIKMFKKLFNSFRDIMGFVGKAMNAGGAGGMQNMMGSMFPSEDPLKIKAVRKDVAGTADFLLNCSSHLVRKVDVAPRYEELVMTLLMKTFNSIEDDLSKLLKKLEDSEDDSFSVSKGDDTGINFKHNDDDAAKNQQYLKESQTSPDQHLKSLINWATIAIRFAARIRTLKPDWRDRFPDLETKIYKSMIKYSRAKAENNRKLAPVDTILVAHVDYLLYMVCVMNLQDPNLRNVVYENLKPGNGLQMPQDASILPSALIFHRFLALSNYEYRASAPITEEFIQNQFGIAQVMAGIKSLSSQNEIFLTLFADFISRFIETKSTDIIAEFPQGNRINTGSLLYGRFAVNLIQGTFTENGKRTRDPNAVLRYAVFRQYFASNEPVVPFLGPYTEECPNRFEIKDFLAKGSHYSVCEDPLAQKVTIYRQIPRFKRPCMLVRRKSVIESLQENFSIYANDGIDVYLCRRGNNAHFVWISRNKLNPEFITHGRLWFLYNEITLAYLTAKYGLEGLVDFVSNDTDFEFSRRAKLADKAVGFFDRLLVPTVFFPRLEITALNDPKPVFPLTAETKSVIVPEPLIRFSGGSRFGGYMLKDRLLFLFQQFRFRDRPDVALTFMEDDQGNLEMRGREDLKICEDQIFENDFWPAIMLRKTDDPKKDIRIAFVPIANPNNQNLKTRIEELLSKSNVPITFNFEAEVCQSEGQTETGKTSSSRVFFMEAMAVDKYLIKEIKKIDGSIQQIHGYRLKPTSRLQRILLAYHNLNIRNYDASLALLDPRSEIDHNTPFTDEEKSILTWMVEMKYAQAPEALALRFMAKIHLILDSEQFPTKDSNSESNQYINLGGDLLDKILKKGSLLGAYFVALPLLPKRFHIDLVFKDAMSSFILEQFLLQQYNGALFYPGSSKVVPEKFGLTINPPESPCVSKAIKHGQLTEAALEPLSPEQETTLNRFIENRLVHPYTIQNCVLPELLLRKILFIYENDETISKDLQELVVLHFNFSGNKFDDVEKYLYFMAHPTSIQTQGTSNIREYVDFKKFKKELTLVLDPDDKKMKLPRQPKLNAFSMAVTLNERAENQYTEQSQDETPSSKFDKIVTPLLPKAPQHGAEKDADKINSIKFVSEDFHFISLKDREVYTKIIEKIEEARKPKADQDDSASELQLIALTESSKTQNALQIAISDYMQNRKEPIDFDRLDKKLFDPLVAHIAVRSKSLSAELKRLENNYDQLFNGMRSSKIYLPDLVLSNLIRIFNQNGKPKLKDLRDCFMQMNRKCLLDRLPEMSEKTITKIVQILKSYYIQKIILNNLTAVGRKIEEFNGLAEKASKAQLELDTCTESSTRTELETEIFDHKDTALLFVEDIYNDMEKLLYLELRLQDPVTLNFEFMSAKFHLTNVQVQDIANLATRNWESEFREEVFAAVKNPDGVYSERVKDAINRIEKLKNRFSVKGQSSIDNNMWAFMPRVATLLNDVELGEYETYRQKRPLLKSFEHVGVLQPFSLEKETYFSRVIQRKMAAGKTTVLGTAATVKKADGKTLSVLVILSSLFQSSAPDMQKRTSEFFNTRGIAFSMPKPRLTIPDPKDTAHFEQNFLKWTLTTMITTINSNSYLVVTPETLQSFLNSYVEFLDAYITVPEGQSNPELSICLHLFATIYDIFRTRGSLILDEIDSSMRPQKELNFPTTKRENILLVGVELTADLLLFSAHDKSVLEAGLNLLANQQYSLNDDQFTQVRTVWRSYIETQLNNKKSRWHEVFFPSTHNDQLYDTDRILKFIFDPSPLDKDTAVSKQDLEEDNAVADELNWMLRVKTEGGDVVFHAMMVVKMQIKNWLKSCFKGAVNEHYGPSLDTSTGKRLLYAIPYMAANTPAEGSIFADRWETVNKTFMLYLVMKLGTDELSRLLLDLREINQKNDSNIDITSEFSKACPAHNLLTLKFNNQNRVIDADGSLAECMGSRSEAALRLIFTWVIKIVFENEEFYAEQITSNAINLTTMFPSVQGYSGTIDNVNILPHQVMIEAEEDHRINEEANGAITMKLLQQKECVTTVQNIENYTKIDALMDVMCKDFKELSGFSAFVDVGALLKDYKNADVALALARKFNRRTILYYNERTNQLSFLEYDPKKRTGTFKALEGSETNYLNSATGSEVKDRFTFYDQRHITGSDILQPPTAKAFLTIGPKVLLRDILQGVMRMRQFQSGQSIHFITTSAVENLISKACDTVEDVNTDGKPRIKQHHLIALGAMNEDEKQLAENVRLYRVKIDAELRAFVLDSLTDALAQVDPYMERESHKYSYSVSDPLKFGPSHEHLFKATRSLFIRDVHENPVNWATINVQTNTKEAVLAYRDGRIKMIPDEWKSLQEWTKVEANLQTLVDDLPENEEERKNSKYARSLLNYLKPTIERSIVPPQFAGSKSEIVDQGSTVEMELQLELQQELQLELEQALSIDYYSSVLPEPTLNIPRENVSDPYLEANMVQSQPQSLLGQCQFTKTFDLIESIKELQTPWNLARMFMDNTSNGKELKKIFSMGLLCPEISGDANDQNFENRCKNGPGFVGMTHGVAKICTSYGMDFVTMSAREATHLLFWRGRSSDSDDIKDYKYAVFLLTGSEARSLHANWGYRSELVSSANSFWLTDLLGFEIHGAPLASTAFSSRTFSLLEKEYKDHFADLHFRALVLNGTYNVIMATNDMYKRMRAWLGDVSLGEQNELEKVDSAIRAKYFLSRLTWMSKLRHEIVPEDPFIRDISRLTMKLQVDFEQTAAKIKEHLIRGTSMTTYSDNLMKNLETPGETFWSVGKNVNKAPEFPWKGLLIFLSCLILLAVIAFVWGRSAGIDWVEFSKSKWSLFLALFHKAPSVIESISDDDESMSDQNDPEESNDSDNEIIVSSSEE